MVTFRRATLEDAASISDLLEANGKGRRTALRGLSGGLRSAPLSFVATTETRLLGVLFSSETVLASAPPVLEMVRVWSGSPSVFVYGPGSSIKAPGARGF